MMAQKVTAKSPTAERVSSRQLLAAALQNGGYRPLSDGMEPPSFAGLLAQDIIKDIARLHLRCELLDAGRLLRMQDYLQTQRRACRYPTAVSQLNDRTSPRRAPVSSSKPNGNPF
jgi:hypothetical protein